MKTNLMNAAVLAMSIGLVACAKSKSVDVMRPPEIVQKGGAVGDELQVEFNPQVDILFVIDNSESMKDEQDRLRAGIASFVNGMGENSVIDYRVGVVTVHDSRSCGRMRNEKLVECYPVGQLQPLKNEAGVAGAPGFISRGEGSANILKATLDVGAKPYAEGGPEFEEMFSPVLSALSPDMNARANGGFIRKNSQVVVIFVSDENDSSDISVEEFIPSVQALLSHPAERINGADRLKMYGVLALDGCPRQSFAVSPKRIVRAVQETQGRVFRICDSSFGKSLSTIGSDIRERLMQSSIQLNARPDHSTLKVFYGEAELVKGKNWTYNPSTNRIEIKNNLNVQPKPGTKFRVQFDKVSDNAIKKGNATAVVY